MLNPFAAFIARIKRKFARRVINVPYAMQIGMYFNNQSYRDNRSHQQYQIEGWRTPNADRF